MKEDLDQDIYPSVNGRKLSEKEEYLKELRDNLKGKSLEIYYFMTKNPDFHGVREIQRSFGYSSPNLAQYHLKRLYEAELIVKNDQNQYKIIDDPVKLGVLEDQVQIMNIWIPHSFVYAMSLIILAIFSLIFLFLDLPGFIYPITSIPILTTIAFLLLRDGRKIMQLKSKGELKE